MAALETAIARFTGAPQVLATSSGTTALELALRACDVGPGNEVALSTYDWGAAAGAALRLGAVPVTVDVDADTYTMDPADLARRLSRRTRAVVVTHLFGQPAAMGEIVSIARNRACVVIEDACQALGARIGSRHVGTMGDVGVLSFGWGKAVAAGEGGALLTGSRELYGRAVDLGQHPVAQLARTGRVGPLGPLALNGRMHPVAAAMALDGLEGIDGLLAAREVVATRLARAMVGLKGIRPPGVRPQMRHAWHRLCPTLVPAELGDVSRGLLIAALEAEGVPVNLGCVEQPLHRLGPLASRGGAGGRRAVHPVAEARCDTVGLGVGSALDAMSQRTVSAIVRAFEKVLSQLDVLASLQARWRRSN